MFDKAFKRTNTFVEFKTDLVESSSKRAGEELEQESTKKQKVDEDKDTTELQSLMEVIPDEEEVAIDAVPLAIKPITISTLLEFAIWNDLHAGRKEISPYTTYNYRYAEQEASVGSTPDPRSAKVSKGFESPSLQGSAPAIRSVMAFNTMSILLVISLCYCLKLASNLVSPRLFCSGLKVYHLPPASSVCEDANSTKDYLGSSMQYRVSWGPLEISHKRGDSHDVCWNIGYHCGVLADGPLPGGKELSEETEYSLSRLHPDAVTKSLTPSLDGSRRCRFMPATPSPHSVSNTFSRIWCRSVISSISSPNEPDEVYLAFGGNTRDLGSFGEETDKTTYSYSSVGSFDVFFRNQLLVFQQHQDESLYDSWTRFKDIIRKVPYHGLSIWTLIEIFLKHLDSLSCHIINLTTERDLRKFSDIGALYAIEDCAQYDKKYINPTSTISDETIANPNAQIVGDDMANQPSDSEIFYPKERIKELELRTQQRNNFEEELFKDSIIDSGLSEVVLGQPFAHTSKLAYDESLGLIRFAQRDDEVVFRMPQRTKELDLVSSLEKDKFEAFFVENLKVIFNEKKRGSS
ncbi:hypothetical protein Tco_0586228 [Tanacetum coccineum]